jgi:hypothetical protein
MGDTAYQGNADSAHDHMRTISNLVCAVRPRDSNAALSPRALQLKPLARVFERCRPPMKLYSDKYKPHFGIERPWDFVIKLLEKTL